MTETLPFDAVRELDVDGTTYKMADLRALEEQGLCDLARSR
jgi:aconitate hydratase